MDCHRHKSPHLLRSRGSYRVRKVVYWYQRQNHLRETQRGKQYETNLKPSSLIGCGHLIKHRLIKDSEEPCCIDPFTAGKCPSIRGSNGESCLSGANQRKILHYYERTCCFRSFASEQETLTSEYRAEQSVMVCI